MISLNEFLDKWGKKGTPKLYTLEEVLNMPKVAIKTKVRLLQKINDGTLTGVKLGKSEGSTKIQGEKTLIVCDEKFALFLEKQLKKCQKSQTQTEL